MKNVCVVGGSGFIGSHIADYLSENNYSVRIFDLYQSKWIKKDQKMIIGDVTNLDSLISALDGCEFVYNFAGISDLNKALYRPIETVRLNILGNVNILEACKINKIKRYIYASSQYVNSREGGFYRCSKQSAELYVEEYKQFFDYTILRFGSLYGPRAGLENGIYNIIYNSLKDKKISYKGNANSVREYIHVFDAAKGCLDILSDEFKNKIVVLTGQQSMKVKDVLYMLDEILDYKGKVEFTDDSYIGHYVRTPYAFEPRVGVKYNPTTYIDLGQGLLRLVSDIKNDNNNN